jgi:hypothetical protein
MQDFANSSFRGLIITGNRKQNEKGSAVKKAENFDDGTA